MSPSMVDDSSASTSVEIDYPQKDNRKVKFLVPIIMGLSVIVLLLGFLGFKWLVSDISCAGFVGTRCPQGYWCRVTDQNPDSLGRCVKDIFGKEHSSPSIITPAPTSPTEEPMLDWITYTDYDNQFEFKYPDSYLVTNGRGQHFINAQPVIELEGEILNIATNSLEGLFTVTVKPNGKSDCEYVPRSDLGSLQERLVNGVKFNQFSNTGAAAGMKYSNTIFHHLRGTTCYEIAATIVEGGNGNTVEGISKIEQQKEVLGTQLDQIVSTFLFTSQTAVTPTNNPEGKFCGGIAGIACSTGYRCQLDGSYPDAGGICVKQ